MAQTYFLTGALGCIGSWVVKALVERGDRAVIFDRSQDARRLHAILEPADFERLRFITGDITDAAAVREALASSTAQRVIHLAGLQVPTCKAEPLAGAMVNVVGTLNLFETARAVGVERLVYASSAAVFGLPDGDGLNDEELNYAPLDEAAACEPATHYGVFKRANEGNARVYFLDHGLSSVGLRPLTVYGVNRDTGLTSDPTKAMKAAVLDRAFHIRFGGATDFQYVADTAATFIACADRAPAGAHVFNLHGETVTVARIAEVINQVRDEILSQARNSETRNPVTPDLSRPLVTFGGAPIPIAPALTDAAIRHVIGDLPLTPLATGIRETMRRFAALRDAGRLDTSDLE